MGLKTSNWKSKSLERTTFFPFGTGLDSTQGFLEFAIQYDSKNWTMVCDPKDAEVLHSVFFHLSELEKEGHLVLDWAPYLNNGRDLLQLKQIALTTSGHKLLAELRAKSKWGKMKGLFATVISSVITSIVTTLAVLAIKGCSSS